MHRVPLPSSKVVSSSSFQGLPFNDFSNYRNAISIRDSRNRPLVLLRRWPAGRHQIEASSLHVLVNLKNVLRDLRALALHKEGEVQFDCCTVFKCIRVECSFSGGLSSHSVL